jgi:hypothetical protein
MRNVNGENAADCPFAARGVPQPFHRFRHGIDPSFHAIRTAFAQGPIWVATSFKFGFAGVGCGRALQGGRLTAWSTGKMVRVVTNAGRRKSAGSIRKTTQNRPGMGRPSQRATATQAIATAP